MNQISQLNRLCFQIFILLSNLVFHSLNLCMQLPYLPLVHFFTILYCLIVLLSLHLQHLYHSVLLLYPLISFH
jgi:hypothetical protein